MKTNIKLNLCCGVLNRIVFKPNLNFQLRYYSGAPGQNLNKKLNPFNRRKFRHTLENESKVVTRMCITILGNGAIGQPRCVALFTDFKAFMFNCGEGVGRLCREYEIDFGLLRHTLITHSSWKNLSGFPDVYLTNEVFGVKQLSMYGPPGIENCISLITSNSMKLNIIKRTSYQDENLEITHIPIKSSTTRIDSNFDTKKGNDDLTFSYVCRIFKRLGEFNPEKCVDLGVPFGSHLLKLKNGEDVTLPSGRVVCSADVLDAPQPAITFLVVECPSEKFLDTFVNEEQFSEYHLPADNANDVDFVFHFSPQHITATKEYQSWIQKFHPNTHHYILNSSNPSLSSGAVDQTQNILNLVHSDIFSLLPSKEKVESLSIPGSSVIIHPPPMLQMHLRPEKKLSWHNVVKFNSENYEEMLSELPDFNKELSKLKSSVYNLDHPKNNEKYPEVLFLGTSSSTSTAFRNVSSILVNINSSRSVLLDCGEGTFMQLVRYYGKENIDRILQNISCVFITHKHTDHYLGLFEFLNARKEALERSGAFHESIVLVLPYLINEVYHKYCELFETYDSSCRIFICKHLLYPNKTTDYLKKILDDVELLTVPVRHCSDAYGVVLQFGSKWKIVYSGDTAPCQKLIEAGENCTLLIHEASIENNLVSEATYKMHSTPAQVVDVAERMNAQYTIMTHFSKRYLAIPLLPEYKQIPIGYAFDFMKVQLHQLPLLSLFLPALKCLFQEQLHSHLEKSSPVADFENIFLKTYRSLKNR